LKNWLLIGFKSCGKTTLGQKLAQALDWPFLDTDQALGGHTDALYRELGERQFRQRERELVESLVGTRRTVIAAGGGTQGLELLRPHSLILYLYRSPELLWERISAGPMPAFLEGADPYQRFLELYAQREPAYRALAHLVVD
jgi:shikimate kinase